MNSDEVVDLREDVTKVICQACHSTEQEDEELELERLWVQCDKCDSWMHTECLSQEIDVNENFVCPKCSTI
jgi:acetyl-CoA carboxylase beta subunit